MTWPADLRRVKVFTGHDRTRPVGYLTALTETGGGLTAEMHIAATPDGDAALLEAREGTRDALSVELEDVELDEDGELVCRRAGRGGPGPAAGVLRRPDRRRT